MLNVLLSKLKVTCIKEEVQEQVIKCKLQKFEKSSLVVYKQKQENVSTLVLFQNKHEIEKHSPLGSDYFEIIRIFKQKNPCFNKNNMLVRKLIHKENKQSKTTSRL